MLFRLRKRTLRPARVYNGKPKKLCDSNSSSSSPLINKRLKRKPMKLSANDSVFGTPFIQKRKRKIVTATPMFDKSIAGLVTSTPATATTKSSLMNKNSNEGDSTVSEKLDADLSEVRSTAKELFTSTELEIIEIADTIKSDASNGFPSRVMSSFSRLIHSSVNAEAYKNCKLSPSESRSIFQLDDSSKISENISIASSAMNEVASVVLPDDENNQNALNRSEAPVLDVSENPANRSGALALNVPEEQPARGSKSGGVKLRNIQFITSKTMSSTLELSLNETDANTHQKFVIKSGKWRRTLYEFRNKIMLCKSNRPSIPELLHFHMINSTDIHIWSFSSKKICQFGRE